VESSDGQLSFDEGLRGLLAGDFTRLSPLFETPGDGAPCAIVGWFERGFFKDEPEALAEAFSCACFNGHANVVEYFLSKGVDANGGAKTGLNAFHWAANRGQLKVVEILIRSGAALERKNSYGGTVLGCAVWSAVHERKPQHLQIVERLVNAGADVRAAEYPSGDERVDEIIRPK
jgi:hypothetical protein